MRRPIDPTVDVVFKEILGSDHHKGLLIHFLNAILRFEVTDPVVDVVLRNPFTLRAFPDGKLSIVDVRALDQRGREFQIEIQISSHPTLPQRMLHNWCSLYYGRIAEGQSYVELEPVIAIWLLEGELPPLPIARPAGNDAKASAKKRRKTDLVHLPFSIYCPDAERLLTDHFAIHVLQLKHWPADVNIEDDKGRWITFFKEGKNLDPDNPPGWMETPEMREAMGILRKFSEQEENYHLYLSRLDQWREKRTVEIELERARERALREREAKERERVKRKAAESAKMTAESAKNAAVAAKNAAVAAKNAAVAEKEEALTTIDRLRDQLIRAGLDPKSSACE